MRSKVRALVAVRATVLAFVALGGCNSEQVEPPSTATESEPVTTGETGSETGDVPTTGDTGPGEGSSGESSETGVAACEGPNCALWPVANSPTG